MPCATITQTLPRSLHSTQTLWAATFGLAAVQEGAHHLEELALVDRAAAQLEVDRHVVGDGGRGRERVDVLGRGVDDAQRTPSTSRKLRSAWMPPAVAQAPMVTRRLRCAPHLADALGVVRAW